MSTLAPAAWSMAIVPITGVKSCSRSMRPGALANVALAGKSIPPLSVR